jgi:hypothetical protein
MDWKSPTKSNQIQAVEGVGLLRNTTIPSRSTLPVTDSLGFKENLLAEVLRLRTGALREVS